MTCDSPEVLSPMTPLQADENCNQAILEAGKVHHVNSYPHPVSLKTAQTSSVSSPFNCQSVFLPKRPFLFSSTKNKFLPTYHHFVPIYTFTGNLLI